MVSLIGFTSADTGSQVWVNTAHVVAITHRLPPAKPADGAMILIVLPGVALAVTETLDEVIALVRRAIEPV